MEVTKETVAETLADALSSLESLNTGNDSSINSAMGHLRKAASALNPALNTFTKPTPVKFGTTPPTYGTTTVKKKDVVDSSPDIEEVKKILEDTEAQVRLAAMKTYIEEMRSLNVDTISKKYTMEVLLQVAEALALEVPENSVPKRVAAQILVAIKALGK